MVDVNPATVLTGWRAAESAMHRRPSAASFARTECRVGPVGCHPCESITTVTETSHNVSSSELMSNLSEFAAWRETYLRGDEKGDAQVFLDRLFKAFGWGGVNEAGARLEDRVRKDSGAVNFVDLLWKPRVLIEMKKAGVDLGRHFRQAFDYWVRAVPDRPRYVVLCNFDEFWVYDFENQVDAPVDKVVLDDLAARWEVFGFMLPNEKKPRFKQDLVAVTREAADDVAKVFVSMKARKVPTEVAQRFVLQSVMAMFAEDIGLLPAKYFSDALDDATNGSQAYDLIGGLFRAMNEPGTTAGGRFAGVPYFNGGLFSEVVPIELTDSELVLLREAAETNWSGVRPEIFGALFEGSMNPEERHATGAHFTAPAEIARVVGPVIIQPWRERIESATTIDQLEAVRGQMYQFQVLDPACGSGNFLYIAYRELRRLEREVVERIRERRRSEHRAGQEAFGYVSLEQFHGIDINPFAVEIAKVTMQLGKKLADDELHEVGQTLPLDNLDTTIVHGDALFDDWPVVDAIIGNPPFLGRRKMVEELGADYTARLDAKFGPQGVSDFVTYWFPKAHDRLPIGGRAGLVATKSIKQGDGRKASLDYIVTHDGAIIDAVSAMPWSGEAAVTVSIVNWQKGGDLPVDRVLWLEPDVEPLELPLITAALSPEIDLHGAKSIAANGEGVFQGQTYGVVDAFRVPSFKAAKFAKDDEAAKAVLHPVLDGDPLLKKTHVDTWVVDIPTRNMDEASGRYPAIIEYLRSAALPTRQVAYEKEKKRNEAALANNPKARVNHHHGGFLDRWWTLGYRREDYLQAIVGLDRYIALTRTSSELRGPVFTFVERAFRVSDSVVAFPFDSDYAFGILQSKVHETWFRERCTTLETRLTYTSKTVFRSFVWPQEPELDRAQAVADAAAKINEYRAKLFESGITLERQYNVLRSPGHSELRELHTALDHAVMRAYGFDPDEDLLTQLLELNLLTAKREEIGEAITRPGNVDGVTSRSTWAWPAPKLPF